MQKFKTVLICAAVFAATIITLLLTLMLSAMIPNSAIRENMLKSALTYKEKEPYSFDSTGRLCAVSDNYADVILLQIANNLGREPFTTIFDTRYYDGDDYGISAGFYMSLLDESAEPNVDYSRYWHGSAAIVRIFHLFTSIDGIKLISLITALALALLVAAILARRGHYSIATAFILSLAAVRIWNVRLSLEYSPAFIVALIMCVLFLLFEKRGNTPLYYLSVIGGTSVAFFDFLTTETLAITLPLILCVAVRAKENRLGDFKPEIFFTVRALIAFGSAYACTFLAKWTLASLVTGENRFITALSSAGERFSGDTAEHGLKNPVARIFLAPLSNISALFGSHERFEIGCTFVGLIICALTFVSIMYLFYKKPQNRTVVPLMMIVGSLVFVRYILLNNHSYIHNFFTHRALASTVLALLLIIIFCTELPKRKVKVKKK